MNIKNMSFAALASFALASFFVFSSAIVHADKHKSPKDKARVGYDMMQKNPFKALDLTGDQKLRIDAINESYKPQLNAIRSSIQDLNDQRQMLDTNSPDYDAQVKALGTEKARLKQEKKALKKTIHQESLQVLTEEQRIQMKANKAKDKSNMR